MAPAVVRPSPAADLPASVPGAAPATPGSPGGPGSPGSPLGPDSPDRPGSPGGPRRPCRPVSPFCPPEPGRPGWPAEPFSPGRPTRPGSPAQTEVQSQGGPPDRARLHRQRCGHRAVWHEQQICASVTGEFVTSRKNVRMMTTSMSIRPLH